MGKVFERIAYCECGCGQRVKPGTRFVKGHHVKVPGRKNSDETRQKMSESAYNRKPWVPRQCECGCGQWVNKYRRFISGHNTRVEQIGFTWNDEHRKNHAAAMKGRVFSDAGREALRIVRKRDMAKPERREQIRQTLQNKWKDKKFADYMLNAQSRSHNPNKSEQYLFDFLESFWPGMWEYTGDGSVWINGKNPDFIHKNGKKLIVELFGDYWHRGQDPKNREEAFSVFGYKTLVIWERELKDFDSVVDKISNFIECN